MSAEDRWRQVERELVHLGVSENQRHRVKEIRGQMDKIASQGIQTMPDFTLHNVTHSDNLVSILSQLKDKLGFTLGEYEAYLLAAAAYLHDLGMFFGERRFVNEVLPNYRTKLQLCPADKCDGLDKYHLEGKSSAAQIRVIHHLLSAYWLLDAPTYTFGIEPGDQPYLATICRGHRSADLRAQACTCYQNTPVSGQLIHLGLIAGLLRLADALDFYRNRAPDEVLENKAYDFLDNPIALGHWLKHYFVNDPHITVKDEAGNQILECQIVVAVPTDELIGDKTYLEFMRPLFDQHIAEANETDLDIQQYPVDFAGGLHIAHIQAVLKFDARKGYRKLPLRIMSAIATGKSSDIVDFLNSRQATGSTTVDHSPSTAPQPAVRIDDSANSAARPEKPSTVLSYRFSRPEIGSPEGLRRILVLCPLFGASSIYYSNLLSAIITSASRYGYELSIQPIQDVKHKRPLRDYAPHLPDLSGVIAITSQVESSTWLDECRDASVPVVLIHDNIEESKLKDTTVVSYMWPGLDGLRDLVKHLIRDHMRQNPCVVMVNARDHRIREQKLHIIRNTVEEGLSALDITDREHLFHVREYTHDEGRYIVGEILDTNPTVDAIVCLADVTAVGILQELKERKRDDIMVTGFDNIDLAAQFQLTSVDQQLNATGEGALINLHAAIQNPVFTLEPVYVPTTLVRRASCCAPERLRLKVRNPVQRFAIYYLIENERILDMIQTVHRSIYMMPHRLDNTTELIGNAALFPPHVTIKGIFQLDPQRHLQEFLSELARAVTPRKHFHIRVKDVRPYPEQSISLGFDEESEQELRNLQSSLLPVVDRFRNRHVIEPEFRKSVDPAAEAPALNNTYEHGEPFIDELFHPHITIVSGVKDNGDKTTIEYFIHTSSLAGLELEIKKISVVYETMLGSSWEVLKEIPLT